MDGVREGLRAGDRVEDRCAACKTLRKHTVLATPAPGSPMRVICDYCGSQHNYRGGDRTREHEVRAPAPRPAPLAVTAAAGTGGFAMGEPVSDAGSLEALLRKVFREECGLTPVTPAEKWRGGELVLRPGRPGVQEKSWPIDSFFHKVVMLRNRLRVLEQQINSLEVPEDVKAKLQAYITGCYGSLTSFNVLFADDGDRFRGQGEA